jgi:uncharacterized protein YceH (UPF0502 family)
MGEGTGEVKVYGDPAGDAPVVLDEFEVRVLGALLEKQRVTPDVYPLTLNSLVLACNQTTSRDPVVSYDETIVSRTLDRLRDMRLAFVFSGADSRALKYGHKLAERFILADDELAVLCLLFLRGPQTVGELRSRSGRLHEFATLADVESALNSLATKSPQPLVVRLPRQPGTKESRYAHLLSGAPAVSAPPAAAAAAAAEPSSSSPAVVPAASADRLAVLEQDVVALRQELADLRAQFAAFKQQFE